MFTDLLRDDVFRLETPRLWLRWPRAADAAEIARLVGDPEVACATARIPHPYPREAADAFVIAARRDNAAGFSVIYVLTVKSRPSLPIGAIGLMPARQSGLSLGYWLGKPFWRHGLMTEAVRAMIDLAFTWTAAQEVAAAADIGNIASQRVLEKSGFRLIGEGFEDAPARSGPRLSKRFLLPREERCGLFDARPPQRSLELR
jgi:RimJ/RimL family protein N-acetyltransferase